METMTPSFSKSCVMAFDSSRFCFKIHYSMLTTLTRFSGDVERPMGSFFVKPTLSAKDFENKVFKLIAY